MVTEKVLCKKDTSLWHSALLGKRWDLPGSLKPTCKLTRQANLNTAKSVSVL